MIHSATLALFQRALRMDARYARGHFVRWLLGVLIFSALVWSHMHSLLVTSPGLEFFRSICLLNAAFIVLAGTSIFATPITEEKEEGTLGLLKMAGISRVGILLGKSTARIVTSLLLLVVQLPFTLLAVTLGGITFPQILSAYLLLAAFLVYVANLGLFCSVYCRRSGTAAGLTAAVLAGQFLIAPLFHHAILRGIRVKLLKADHVIVQWLEQALQVVLEFSIFARLDSIFANMLTAAEAAQYVWTHLALAGVLFVVAWATFDRLTTDVAMEGPSRLVPIRRRKSRPPLGRTWSNVMMWKEFHFGTGGWSFMLVKTWFYSMMVLIIALVVGETTSPWNLRFSEWKNYQWHDFGTSVMVLSLAAALIELSLCATILFRDEVRWHTLGPILMLPHSLPKLAYSKVAGCLPNLVPVLVAFCVGAWAWPHELTDALKLPSTWGLIACASVFLHTVVLVSLFVKWGSLSLSLAIVLVFGTFCGMPISYVPMAMAASLAGTEFAAVMPIAYFGIGATAVLQFCIAMRLQAVAAE